jgi:hypothetical protein
MGQKMGVALQGGPKLPHDHETEWPIKATANDHVIPSAILADA